ncbi:MAG: hypothetical protein ACRDJ3_02345 [Solirubrobacteraceae bacterium]
MKRFHVLGLALFAVVVFSALFAVTASAEVTLLAEWLINGTGVTALTSVTITGNIVLVNKAGVGGTPRILCEGSFDGSVGPNGEDEITEILNTAGEPTSTTPLMGTPIDCVTLNATLGCGASGTLAEVWAENLPWLTNLELMESGTFLDHLYKVEGGLQPGYDVHCTGSGTDNLCEALATALMENMPTENDVLGIFQLGSEVAPCTIGTGELEAEGLLTTLSGLPIAVSSE